MVVRPGRVRSIAARWAGSNAIEPRAVVALSALAILVLITAAAAVAAWVALAVAAVFREEEVVDFEEEAVAEGDVGRFRSGG